MTVLWLDDLRDPNRYFNKKSESGAFMRNKGFYDDLFSKYDINFIWVKNFDEFTNYILKNGIPEFVSFDHDLGKGMSKGLDCAKWLKGFCEETGQEFPRFFVHSANPNGRREIESVHNNEPNSIKGIESLLSAAVNENKKKRRVKLTEGVLRRIIRESLSEIDFGNISKIDNGHVTPYSPEERRRNFLGLKYGCNNAYEGYKKWYERMKDVLPKEELNWDNYVANYQERFSNLLESIVSRAVNESLSEVSPEMLARAYVGSNVDRSNTGPYFMPDKSDGLMKQSERLKATREKNRDAYNKYLKKK